jgi:hypothetical protein
MFIMFIHWGILCTAVLYLYPVVVVVLVQPISKHNLAEELSCSLVNTIQIHKKSQSPYRIVV